MTFFSSLRGMKKNNSDFNIPFISPLAGSTIHNYLKVLHFSRISVRHYPRLLATFLLIIVSSPFQLFEWLYFRNKVKHHVFKKPPVFIIGHWRSGTTHLHNLLCQDPTIGYVTTYQSVFPNNMKSKWLFKPFMERNIPEHRPSDNVKLSADYPQEEEFALANMTPATFYHFFYFPSQNDNLYKKYIRFQGILEKEKTDFKLRYHELLTKAAYNTGKEQLIIKNPVNTGKIKLLLEMYPDAKFIYIHRNPIITYLSTVRFFNSLLPSTCLESYEDQYVKGKIVENYANLLRDYLNTKSLIPEKNLIEIAFTDLEKNTLTIIKSIYAQLGLDSWEQAEGPITEYISKQKHYQKNSYKIKKEDLETIKKEWAFAMNEYDYKMPENLDVI